MTALLYISAIALVLAAAAATVVYTRAVVHVHRAYLHVTLAGIFVCAIEAYALLSLPQGVLLVANLLGVGAMIALAARFRSRPSSQHSPGESLYDWYRQRRGFVGFAAVVVAVVVGFVVVQAIAEDAGDAAEDAEQAANQAERSSKQNKKLAAANSRLNCGFAKLIRGSPIVRREEETAEAFTRRIVIIRNFARDVRVLATLLDRFNLEKGARCQVADLRVRLTPTDRAALVPEVLEDLRPGRATDAISINSIAPPTPGAGGGDAVGSDPGGGGGQPGGPEPPADEGEPGPQGLADPVVDPAEEQTGIPIHCDVNIAGEVVCTEPD